MSDNKFQAEIDSPKPAKDWVNQGNTQRVEMLNQTISQLNPSFINELAIVSTKNDGQVVVRLLKPLSASIRGTLLLDLEEFLKKNVDEGLTVWGEALGDKNSLRNLRGIEVKAS